MKKVYLKFLPLLVALLTAFQANAGIWSYDWPVSATKDKEAGFYNMSSGKTLTTQTRTLNEREWTINVPEGCYLAFITTSGQIVGKVENGVLPVDGFNLVSGAFEGKIKRVTISARVEATEAAVTVSVNGKEYSAAASPASIAGTALVEHTFTSDDIQEGEIKLVFSQTGATKPFYIKKIEVEWEEEAPAFEAPVLSVAEGTYDEAQTVSITAAEGCEIVYTLDGSNPRTSETAVVYSDPFTVAESTTVKAVARKEGVYGAVATVQYVIRKDPAISFEKSEMTIEWPDDGNGVYLNNPNNVAVTYKSDDTGVAYVDKYGWITSAKVGETVIRAIFAGDDTYYPAEASYQLHVVAKPPMDAPIITPDGGTFDEEVTVTFTATDERAQALWYTIGEEQPAVDEWGLLEDFEINHEPTMTKTFDATTTIWVQAVGDNIWSEVKKASFTVNQKLAARFTAQQTDVTTAAWHFDSEEEMNDWMVSQGTQWTMVSADYSSTVPSFASVNPSSKYSLYHPYNRNYVSDAAYTPEMTVPENAKARFWAVFDPVWIYDANLQLVVVEGQNATVVWNAFLTSQEAGTDDAKWTQYTADLSAFAGKTVELAFLYQGTYGADVMIDDLEIVTANTADDAVANVVTGEAVNFIDLSRGYPVAWEWSFLGAETATSVEQNPDVVYNTPGSYDVTLTITDEKGEKSTVTRKNFVNVRAIPPTAVIGVPAQAYYSPEAALVVPVGVDLTFTDLTKGNVDSREWKIQGADITTSADKEVTFRYTQAGTYDLDLTVKNSAGVSTTYLYQIKAGQEANAWNISTEENTDLGYVSLGYYGNYGGTNWLDMPGFAEKFAKPLAPAEISSVNVYFAKATAVSADAPITVSVAKSENGLPGAVLATAQLKASELVDASETYNDPTVFTFANPVRVEDEFFITIEGFPNADGDDIAMYIALRKMGERNNAFHLLDILDKNNQPTGERVWYENTDEGGISFAISPRIKFVSGTSGLDTVGAEFDPELPVEYYNLQGIRIPAEHVVPGIYVVRQGSLTKKVLVK